MKSINSNIQSILFFVFIILSLKGCGTFPGESISVQRLRCEYRTHPLGIDSRQPRLSWIVESEVRGQFQTGYQILVADSEKALDRDEGNLWDSGRVDSRETIHILYQGRALGRGQRCYWKVRIWNQDDLMSAWSKPAFWETALLSDADWMGEWIHDGKTQPEGDEAFYRDDPAPLFRKTFSVPPKMTRARLYISGLGYYEASINGQRIGNQVLDPGWTSYEKRIFYSTYDVTSHLRRGQNCVGVMLGNGWFNPLPLRMWGHLNLRDHLPVGRPRFIVQLNIEYTDGSIQSVYTDSSWRVHPGPLLRNDIYLGEVYDARREIEDWDQPGLEDSDWRRALIAASPGGQLQAQPQPPIQITSQFRPVSVAEPSPGVFIFDFGQNFAGWARLRLRAPAGNRVQLRFGELLHKDGTLNPMTAVCGQIKGKRNGENIGGPGTPEIADQRDVYIAKGKGLEIYTPRFTFHGFRYVEMTGYPGRPNLNTLEGLRLNTAVESVGSFSCSNEMFNRIQEMTRWTFLSNLFSVQSDCPHREKFGYGGDLVVTSDAFMFNYDMSNFYAKVVRDWHDASLPVGMLTDTAPFVGIHYCGIPWAMAHPHLLDQLFRYYGNRNLLEDQYATANRWLDLVAVQNPNFIAQSGLSDHEGLEPAPPPQMVTPLYFHSAQLLARLAGILGKHDDVDKYTFLALKIKNAYLRDFLEPGTGRFSPCTQASQSFALALNLAPAKEEEKAIDFLINKIINENKSHLSTGIFGTRFLMDVLSNYGHSDIAYAIVNQKTFPGWGHMLENGATTLWEHWAMSENTYSHNHPMLGSVSAWFYNWLAGIQCHPEAVGFDRIIIRPQIVDDLKWVKAQYRSIRGLIKSEWHRETDAFHLVITIPANTTAMVYLPAKEASTLTESGRPIIAREHIHFIGMENMTALYEVASGSYFFTSAIE